MKGKRKEKSTDKDDHESRADEEPERILIKEDMMKKHMPPYFSQALHGKKGTNNASENFEVLRQVKVNIPLLDMIKQVPTYAKFLKDLCTVKRGLNVNKKAFLTEQVSAIIQCKSPVKYKDPGCPTISVSIGGTCVEKALLDLGASISEDSKRDDRRCLVQVDKFYYLVDFVVLDTDLVVKGTNYVPIILGRPFLTTSNAIINCKNGVMQLTFGNMTLELNIFHLYKKHIHSEKEEGLEEVLPEPSDLLATLLPWRRREEILPLFNEEETQRPVKEEPPKLILKPLPTELKYAYLEDNKKCPVVISSALSIHQEDCLLEVLRKCKKTIGWQISDLKGINPLVCTHHIYMEDEAKPICQPQRRLNPHMQEVVRAEVLKLLQAGIIYPISDSPWVLERVSGHPFYCFLDGYSGYFQIEIDVEDQEKATFTCPFGTYTYRRMTFSLCNAPKDLVLNWEKCHFMVHQGIVLGHITPRKVLKLTKRFIKDFSKLARPLWELLVKDAKFIWDDRSQMNFEELKLFLTTAPIVRAPNWQLPFDVMCDASDFAIGAVLGQREDGKPYVIYYASMTLNEAQRNYTTTKKELLVIVFALDKFRAYLVGHFIVIFIDHSALKYLLTKQDAKARLIRWILLLQEFNLQIKDKK
ncbi:Retrovirus-related Pol polyprotein from transposon 17.6 [Vitis vinifera]|uniref:RNA-directed DNA polymerase n=1 Tax=Vitis vinifera TaxID=29760 RepID=A0A438FKB9_VITVI|nr:Retrovirus-related Pol polyprotein from transposon 17.6 [Vitis vinifera]